jgi:hypothetical protein
LSYRRWFSIIFAVFLATAFVLIAGVLYAMQIVRQSDYPRGTGDASIALQDNAFRWHNRDCEVLIIGDSTANVGIDPRLITANTGLSACNMATTRPVIDDLGTIPLDAYLTQNAKPKLIVLQVGPETFYRSRSPWEHVGPYASMVLISRDLSTMAALKIMLRHPAETTQFTIYVVQTRLFPKKADWNRISREYDRMITASEVSGGQLQLNWDAIKSCSNQALPLYGPVDKAWIREIRAKYEAFGIAVLVRAAPVPSCDAQLLQFQHDLAPYVDGNVEALDIGNFIAGARHTTQAGSQVETMGLVRLIQAREQGLLHTAN